MYRFFLRSCKLLGAFIIAGIELGRARCRWRVTVPALSQGRPIRRAAALDLQEHTGHRAGSDPGQASRQSHQSGPDPSRSGLQPAGQPQNRGGRGPSGSRRAVPSHQHRREALFDGWLAGESTPGTCSLLIRKPLRTFQQQLLNFLHFRARAIE